MAANIKFKRGVEASIPTLAAGEPGFTTDSYKLFIGDGSTNHQIGGSAGGLTWAKITGSTTAVTGHGYNAVASADLTLTLPASPSANNEVWFCDAADKATTYTLKIARNGENIESVAQDLTVDTDGSGFGLVYVDSTIGWKIVTEITTPASSSLANTEVVKQVLHDLAIDCTSSTQVVIKSGSTIGADDGTDVLIAASDLTLDITTSGVNGLDTGAEAANTWYYIYLINNGTLTRGLLSASATSPTMPSGYSKKRLVGAVRNDGSSNFKQFNQVDNEVQYLNYETVFNGTSSNWTALNTSAYVPTISRKLVASFQSFSQSSGSAHYVYVAVGSKSGTGSGGVLYASAGISGSPLLALQVNGVLLDSSQIFSFYQSASSGQAMIWTVGYEISF